MSSRQTALPPAGAQDVFYLIDLSGYFFRAYHAICPLSILGGEPTHATYRTVAGVAALAKQLGIPRVEAARLIDANVARHPLPRGISAE